MKTVAFLASVRAVALAAAAAIAVPAFAVPVGTPAVGARFATVATDCYAIGQQIAARHGGTLARATPQERGGQTVCIIVVLMPAKDGQRPRRAEFIVPPG